MVYSKGTGLNQCLQFTLSNYIKPDLKDSEGLRVPGGLLGFRMSGKPGGLGGSKNSVVPEGSGDLGKAVFS